MDTLVVGSGVAGCSAALAAARHGRVMLVSKGNLPESNTRYAQGGIAAALGPEDAPALHFEDTMVAGAGLCDAGAVRFVVERAPGALRSIAGAGMVFDAGGMHCSRHPASATARPDSGNSQS